MPNLMTITTMDFLHTLSSTPSIASLLKIILLISCTTIINAQYLVEILERTQLGGHRPVVRCDATGANFGENVVSFSFGASAVGCALPTEPIAACGNVMRPAERNITPQCYFDFAVVPRGNCTFSEKAFHVQTAQPKGYSALIMFNSKGQSPIPMSGSKFADEIAIPVVMVNYACMQSLLIGQYTAQHGYLVTIKASPGYYDLIKYLIPFVAIVGICFVVLFISLMIRLCRERRRQARKRLPRSYLKKIPTKKYKKGDPEETCAICLEDFQESEKLRILECKHAYHCKCIDPWLTKNRKVCPVCKRRVGPRSSDSSDSDETDAERSSTRSISAGGATTSTAALLTNRDNEPLLRNAQPMATSSSSDCPYPPHPIPSLLPGPSPFTHALNFVQHGNVFHQARDVQHTNGEESDTGIPTNTLNTQQQSGTSLPISSALGDLSSTVGRVQASTSSNTTQRLRLGLANIRAKLADLVFHGKSGTSNPHTILENEDEGSNLTREENDSESRQTSDTLDATSTNNSSADGYSQMTTMHSNRHILSVTVQVESSSSHSGEENRVIQRKSEQ